MVSNFRHLVETLLSKMDTKLKLSDAVITYSTFEGMFLWVCKQDDHRYKDYNFVKSRLSINAKGQWLFGYNNPQVYNMEWDARVIINLDEFNLGTDIL